MMNHFVIANWYSEAPEDQIQSTNTLVKILKYYPGAELTGQVTMSDDGQGSSLAFACSWSAMPSPVKVEKTWTKTPTGSPSALLTQTKTAATVSLRQQVRFAFSAFAGDYDPTSSRDRVRDGSYGEGLSDILTETNSDRQINEITALLGQVANMTWLGEAQLNVTGDRSQPNGRHAKHP